MKKYRHESSTDLHSMTPSTLPPLPPEGRGIAVCVSLLLMAACGQRDKAPPPVREVPIDASMPVPMVDAFIDRGLGKYESIKARFEADCPRDLRRAIGEVPSLHLADGSRNCRRPFAEQGRKDVARYVDLVYEPAGGASYDHVNVPISRVTIGYFGADASPMPTSCARAVGEVVEYLRQLTGATEQQGHRVAALMHSRPTKGAARIMLLDRELCVSAGASKSECFADVSTCDLAVPEPIVDIDLATVDLPTTPPAPAP